MRNFTYGLLTLLLAGALAGCGAEGAKEELDKNDDNKAGAKVETSGKADDKPEAAEEEDTEIWTYYNDASWSDEFNGLKVEIQKVVVSDIAPTMSDESANASAVGIKFSMENTTDHVFTTYPDQAVLVTSTGEQIEMPDMWLSDDLGGDIHEGVIKEGNVIWYLERGQAEAIEWIKLEWNAEDTAVEDFSKAYHTFAPKIELK